MKSSTAVVVIAAIDENRVIGSDGELPWNFPEDMQRFKRLTTGNPLIMGRKTHENIVSRYGGTLPDRTHIVLSESHERSDFCSGVILARSIESAIDAGEQICHTSRHGSAIYVIGGESVYHQFIEYADRIELTQIYNEYEGDAYFPELDHKSWSQIYADKRDELEFVSLTSTEDMSDSSELSVSV